MKRAKLKILRNFFKYSASELVTFGLNNGASLDPAKFPGLIVTPKDITDMSNDLSAKQAATLTGGPVETAARTKAFEALANALNANANVVEVTVGVDMEMLLATGYLPASTSHTKSPLDDTAIEGLLNNGSTQALLQLLPVTNAKTYQVQTSVDGGKTWQEAGLPTQARRFVLTNLTPGATYLVRARAIGGSTGASNWTNPESIMSL